MVVTVPEKVVSGLQVFMSMAAPVHFVPRYAFILNFWGFSGEKVLRALSFWVSRAGGENKTE